MNNRNKPPITVIDAVMGTGKSTWIAKSITQHQSRRYIVVLPRIKELQRYEGLLRSLDGLVSIRDGEEVNGIKKSNKTDQFRDALSDAQVILITHALFEEYLTTDIFNVIREGEWSLIMDEVISVFEPVQQVTSTDISGLIAKGVMQEVQLTERVARLQVNPKTIQWYLGLPATDASKLQKRMVRQATLKDVLIITEEQETKAFPTFSLREERLDPFRDVTILTYPFKNTDLDYWLQIKGYHVDHLQLTRVANTDSIDDFRVTAHDGKYSGQQFKDLVELVGQDTRGERGAYGEKPNHFSATEYSERMIAKTGKLKEHLKPIQRTMRRMFRNSQKVHHFVEPDDFMFTCPASVKSVWKDPQNGLPSAFIGETTWVPFNERATNDLDGKHNLAFLYNVYPFTGVEKIVQAFGLTYDREQVALYVLIQWIWRSAIRKGEKIRLYLPSKRMRDILNRWLEGQME